MSCYASLLHFKTGNDRLGQVSNFRSV